MAMDLRTPRKTTKGLGSAKEGVRHWIAQRVTALALVVLIPAFLVSFLIAYESGYDGARAWLASPLVAVMMLALVSAAFYHMRLGLQVVIEDYIQATGTKITLLVLNTFTAIGLWILAVFSILLTAFGSAA